MSLNKDCRDWAKELNSTKIENRLVENDKIKEYDIKNVAKNMEVRYLNMYEDKSFKM